MATPWRPGLRQPRMTNSHLQGEKMVMRESADKIAEIRGRLLLAPARPGHARGPSIGAYPRDVLRPDLAEDIFVGAVRSVYSPVLFSQLWDVSLGSMENWAQSFRPASTSQLENLVGSFDHYGSLGQWPSWGVGSLPPTRCVDWNRKQRTTPEVPAFALVRHLPPPETSAVCRLAERNYRPSRPPRAPPTTPPTAPDSTAWSSPR
jgi:hypothetical protein